MKRDILEVPMNILKHYVQGLVYEYFSYHSGKSINIIDIDIYITNTLDLVVPYLNGRDVLAGRASVYQVLVCQKAYDDFKDIFKKQ